MKKTKVGEVLREMRGEQTQQQLAMDLNVSREAVSKWENGRAALPEDIAQTVMARKENPRLGFAIRNEYTKTGPMWLNGPNVDLHRSSVREKTMEEVMEAFNAIQGFSFAKPLQNITEWERPNLYELLEEVAEAITALETFLVRTCEESGISYTGVWEAHHKQLRAKGWLE